MKNSLLLLSLFSLSLHAAESPVNADAISSAQVNSVQDSETYTYVRCWYRTGASHNDSATDWEWALDKDGDYYKVDGYWWSSISYKNMFYTDVPQAEIKERCEQTLDVSHDTADITFFAADNRLSYNHTFWTNDTVFQPKGINKFVVFGDSLSDTGNMFNGSQWLFPNRNSWFLGHFTNGLVWTEYIAKEKNIPVYNWAVGGAAGSNKYIALTGVKDQVESYLTYRKMAKNYQPENTLYAVEFGLNDFMNYDRSVADAKADYIAALGRLVNSGAKNILLLTLPDATKAPQFKYSPEKVAEVKEKILAFNQFIREQSKQYPDANVVLFDAHALFENMTETPEAYGFKNASDPCLDINRSSSFDYLISHSLSNECAQHGSDKFVFWGVTHPTTAAHKLIAERMLETSIKEFDL